MGAKACIVSGAILIVLGLGIGIGWLFGCLPLVYHKATPQLKQALIVDSAQAEGYLDWANGTAQRNPNYYVYYFWNMTNSDDVIANGSKPEYQQVGPFYYRYYWYNNNPTWTEDGNKVEYSFLEDYIFDRSQSFADPKDVLITNINPAYLGLLIQTGSEGNILAAATRPLLGSFLDFMTTKYIDVVESQYTPHNLILAKYNIIQQLLPFNDNNTIAAEQYFYEQWANATGAPITEIDWTGMLVGPAQNTPSPTNLSLATVQLLFNNNVMYSLLDNSTDAAMYWYSARLRPAGDEALTLMNTFNVSFNQLKMITLWRSSSFIPAHVEGALIAESQQYLDGANRTDIGWIQYTLGVFTQPSITEFYGDRWFPQYPVAFELSVNDVDFTVAQTQFFYAGPYGILDVNNFQDYMAAVSLGNVSKWGITMPEAYSFLGYQAGPLATYTQPIVQDFVNNGSGLIITQTADYWLWRCLDPLVTYIAGAANASCTLQFNHTAQPPSQIWTGKDDYSKLNQYVKWRGQTQIDLFQAPVPVKGCAENGQFALLLKPNTKLQAFDESLTKTVTLNYVGKDYINDIFVYKYIFSNDVFDAVYPYAQTIQGFANESAANQGAPVYLSNWDFYYVNSKYGKMDNMHPTADDLTTIWVEPNTGNTLKADMKLQVNFYFEAGGKDSLDVFQFANVPDDTFYPVLKAWQKSIVGDEDTKRLTTQLKQLQPGYLNGLRFGIVGAGAFIVLVGIFLVVRGNQLKNRGGYHNIQDGSRYY